MFKQSKGYSKFVYLMGGKGGIESGGEAAEKVKGEAAEKAAPTSDESTKRKEAAASMTKGAESNLTKLAKKEGPEVNYEAKPFNKEELKEKTKGYPEMKPADKELRKQMIEAFEDQRGHKMEHGDTIAADKDDKEYIVLYDETQKGEKARMFKG